MELLRPNVSRAEVFHASAYFTGHVQGVGFRYKTLQIAKEFELSGFVRNRPDGRVELQAEGQESEVRAFVAEVEDRLSVYIRITETSTNRRRATYKGFTIGF
jgi:acylphosphatase